MQGVVNDYDFLKNIRAGKSLEEYAEMSGAAPSTLEHHLETMAEADVIHADDVISSEDQDIVVRALAMAEWNGRMRPAAEILEGRYPYNKLKPVLHNPTFLKKIEEEKEREGRDTAVVKGLIEAYEKRGKAWYGKIPGIYTYFIFSKEDENQVLFIDVTKNLGKVVKNCRDTASKVGYIEVASYEEGKVLAGYYTAGMKPLYPSCNASKNVILAVDEKKRKPGMIRLSPAKKD